MPQHQLDYQTPGTKSQRNEALGCGIGLVLLGLTLNAWGGVGTLFVMDGFSGDYKDILIVVLLSSGGLIMSIVGIRLVAR